MIYLDINNQDYYDETRTLVRAFYPKIDTTTDKEADYDISVSVTVKERSTEVIISSDEKTCKKHMVSPDDNVKNIWDTFKSCVYGALSEYTERTLPWGMLTGVRPAKIVLGQIEAGKSTDDIRQYMMSYYGVSRLKTDLAIDVAIKENELLKKIDYNNGISLYIGIPFCPTTCLYCSFTSYPLAIWKKSVDAYIDALIKEMKSIAPLLAGKCIQSVYFGGGTPTTLEPQQSEKLLNALFECFDMDSCTELTVEAGRPDSVTDEKLKVLKAHGVDRISINPQTMKQETLELIGRRHSVKQVIDAFKLARENGFNNINMDLIVGLPGETIEDIDNTMREIEKLGPDSITVHSLAVKRAAALKMWQKKNTEYGITNTWEMIDLTYKYAKKNGLEPYYLYRQKNMAGNFENVGYSKKGYECLYNILIMEAKQTIVAFGAGGSSKFVFPQENRIERVENVKDVRNYIDRIDEMIERKRSFIEANDV